MLVWLGSLHCQFPLDSGQNFAILIQNTVPGVGSFFKLWVSLILCTKTLGKLETDMDFVFDPKCQIYGFIQL